MNPPTDDSTEEIYAIPTRYRRTENLHILFWLIKDACWALNFSGLAMLMIIPTLSVAIWISWRSRHITSELTHNLAVVAWIVANCTWMVGEFLGIDAKIGGFSFGLRQIALIPFGVGLLILAVYYLVIQPREKKKSVSA